MTVPSTSMLDLPDEKGPSVAFWDRRICGELGLEANGSDGFCDAYSDTWTGRRFVTFDCILTVRTRNIKHEGLVFIVSVYLSFEDPAWNKLTHSKTWLFAIRPCTREPVSLLFSLFLYLPKQLRMFRLVAVSRDCDHVRMRSLRKQVWTMTVKQ